MIAGCWAATGCPRTPHARVQCFAWRFGDRKRDRVTVLATEGNSGRDHRRQEVQQDAFALHATPGAASGSGRLDWAASYIVHECISEQDARRRRGPGALQRPCTCHEPTAVAARNVWRKPVRTCCQLGAAACRGDGYRCHRTSALRDEGGAAGNIERVGKHFRKSCGCAPDSGHGQALVRICDGPRRCEYCIVAKQHRPPNLMNALSGRSRHLSHWKLMERALTRRSPCVTARWRWEPAAPARRFERCRRYGLRPGREAISAMLRRKPNSRFITERRMLRWPP